MIIYRSFAREALRNTVAITFVLAIVMSFIGLTVLLGRAVRGDVPDDIMLKMLSLESLRRLDLLLTLGLFLGVLITGARWYRDSEMTVLAACGIGLTQMLRPTIVLTGITALVVAVLSFSATPWALNRMEFIKAERERQLHLTGIAPGVFNESPGNKVFYAERVQRDGGVLAYVFASGVEKGKEGVVVARAGYPRSDERTGDRFLVLVDGNFYEGTPGDPGYRLLRFETLHIRLDTKPFVEPPPKIDGTSSLELWRDTDPEARAQWHWRLAKPVMAVVLVLFSLVLAYTDPRRGRLANLFVAVLVYAMYSNLLALGQTLIKRETVPPGMGLWWVHLAMFAVAVYLFRQRATNRPLLARPVMRRRR
jgi:lipopolysaccharide export system permease protein